MGERPGPGISSGSLEALQATWSPWASSKPSYLLGWGRYTCSDGAEPWLQVSPAGVWLQGTFVKRHWKRKCWQLLRDSSLSQHGRKTEDSEVRQCRPGAGISVFCHEVVCGLRKLPSPLQRALGSSSISWGVAIYSQSCWECETGVELGERAHLQQRWAFIKCQVKHCPVIVSLHPDNNPLE